jgi:hypothetical protein
MSCAIGFECGDLQTMGNLGTRLPVWEIPERVLDYKVKQFSVLSGILNMDGCT